MDNKSLQDSYIIPSKLRENEHLLDLFTEDKEQYYLELGNVSYDTLQLLLMKKAVPLTQDNNNIKALVSVAIENEGLGHCIPLFNGDESTQALIPFIYYMNFDNNNESMRLFLTYGLLTYRYKSQDRYAPLILLPVSISFKDQDGYLQLEGEPLANTVLLDLLSHIKKSFKLSSHLGDNIYQLDKFLDEFKRPDLGWAVHYENYLTLAKVTCARDVVDTDLFNGAHNIYSALDDEFLYTPQPKPKKSLLTQAISYDIYMNEAFNAKERRILTSALDGNTLAITGYSGSGKSSVCRAIAVNALYRHKKVLYVSPVLSTLWDLEKELKALGLSNFYHSLVPFAGDTPVLTENASSPFPKDDLIEQAQRAKELEHLLSLKQHGFNYCEVLTQCALLSNKSSLGDLPIKNITTIFYKEDFIEREGLYVLPDLVKLESLMTQARVYKDSVYHILNRKNINKEEAYDIIAPALIHLSQDMQVLIDCSQEMTDQFGFKEITSFNTFRQVLEDYYAIDIKKIPTFWLTGHYHEAEHLFQDLLLDLEKLRLKEHEIENDYQDLDQQIGDINQVLSDIMGPYFTYQEGAKIDALLLHKNEIYDVSQKALAMMDSNLDRDIRALTSQKDYKITIETINLLKEQLTNNPSLATAFLTVLTSPDIANLYALFHTKNTKHKDNYESFKGDCVELNKTSRRIQDYLAFFKGEGSLVEQMNWLATYIYNRNDLNQKERLHFKTLSNQNRMLFKEKVKEFKNYKKIYDKYREQIKHINQEYKVNYTATLEQSASSYAALTSNHALGHIAYNVIQCALNKRSLYQSLVLNLGDFCSTLDYLNQAYALGCYYGIAKEHLTYAEKTVWIQEANRYLNKLYQYQSLLQSIIKTNHLTAPMVLFNDFIQVKNQLDERSILQEKMSSTTYQEAFGSFIQKNQGSQIPIDSIELYLEKFKALQEATGSLDDLKNIIEKASLVNPLLIKALGTTRSIITYNGIVNHYFNKEFNNYMDSLSLVETRDALNPLITAEHLQELKYYIDISVILNQLWARYSYLGSANNSKDSSPLVEYHDLEEIIHLIAQSNTPDQWALRLSYQFFTSLKREFELTYPHTLTDMIDQCGKVMSLEEQVRLFFNKKVVNEIIRSHNGLERDKDLILAPAKMLHYLYDKSFDVVIIDDAHALSPLTNPLLKDTQLIVAGDYLNYKIEWETLISKFDAVHQYVLDYRFKPTARSIDLGLQYYRLKNLDMKRFGYIPLYEDDHNQYKEITLAPNNYRSQPLYRVLLTSKIKKLLVAKNNLNDFLKVSMDYVLEGHELSLIMNAHDLDIMRDQYNSLLKNYALSYDDDKVEAIKERLSLINIKSLSQELDLLKINNTLDEHVQPQQPALRIESLDQLTLLNQVVYDICSQKVTYNILSESINHEKEICEYIVTLFLEKNYSLMETSTLIQQYVRFSHLSHHAIPSDKTILITSDYEGVSEKYKIANMLTQLLFNSSEIILFDDTTHRRTSSFQEARDYEFLGILKNIALREDFPVESSFMDPLASFESSYVNSKSVMLSPEETLLVRIKDIFNTLGCRVYLAQKPLDLYVIPADSSVLYSVMVLSSSFKSHLSILNDYRDTYRHIKNLRIINMTDAAKDLEEAVKQCYNSMEESHA